VSEEGLAHYPHESFLLTNTKAGPPHPSLTGWSPSGRPTSEGQVGRRPTWAALGETRRDRPRAPRPFTRRPPLALLKMAAASGTGCRGALAHFGGQGVACGGRTTAR
jgi:hypothetical protein